jgi:flagellar biosynthesis protein FlhB
MDQARTEAASPRKQARARERGVVASSAALTAAGALLALSAALLACGAQLLDALRSLLLAALDAGGQPLASSLPPAVSAGLQRLCGLSVAVMLAIAASSWLLGLLQVGPLFAPALISLEPRRLAPFARMRKWLSGERMLESLWAAARTAILLAIAIWALRSCARAVFAAGELGAGPALHTLGEAGARLLLRIASAAAVLGVADLALRRVWLARQLRMSRHELVREQRESHGLPEHRARRLHAYRALSHAGQLDAVRAARVLLLGDGGCALALGFDVEAPEQRAPRLLAKSGPGATARLQHAAHEAGVQVRWDAQLVSALYRLEPGDEIPRAQYQRVAELLRALRDSP